MNSRSYSQRTFRAHRVGDPLHLQIKVGGPGEFELATNGSKKAVLTPADSTKHRISLNYLQYRVLRSSAFQDLKAANKFPFNKVFLEAFECCLK